MNCANARQRMQQTHQLAHSGDLKLGHNLLAKLPAQLSQLGHRQRRQQATNSSS
jgi:hypothetical protein